MSLTLPAVSFNPAATIYGSKVIVVFTPSVGSPINIIAKVADAAYKYSTVEAMFPGTDNVLRPQRSCSKDAEERYELVEMEDVDVVLQFMGGFTGAHKVGTAMIYVCEQDDPTGTSVREKSDAFPCSITVKPGTTKFGGGDFAKIALSILSLKPSPVVWTPNATS